MIHNQSYMLTSDQLKELAEMVAEKIVSAPSVKPKMAGGIPTGKANELLSRVQVIELLGVSLNTVCRWERNGILTPVHVNGRIVRYRREQVEGLISSSVKPSNV